MNPLNFFIDNFISKNRKERWQYLANGKWEKFADKIKDLDKHLNSNCDRIDNNALEKFKEIIKKYNIKSGYYYDFYSNKLELRVDDFHDIRDDSLLICPDKKIAFFFHHDGWIWFCKINDNLINF